MPTHLTEGSGANRTVIEPDGTLVAYGDATVWDDLRTPVTQARVGALGKPDFDFTNVGYLFPQNDTSETLSVVLQMPHSWKAGSDIYPHVHYRRTSAGKPTFKIDYAWFNIGAEVAAPTTTVTMGTEVIAYTSGSIHQINKASAPISGSGKTISSMLLIKLYRDDNAVTGDVLVYEFDLHYEIDMLGSRTEFTK